MKRYRIMHILTHAWWEGEALNPTDAYKKAGWPWRECRMTEHSTKGAGGWKKVREEEAKK